MTPPQPEPQPDCPSQPQPKPSYLSFKDIPVWQTAMAVAEQVFAVPDGLTRNRRQTTGYGRPMTASR